MKIRCPKCNVLYNIEMPNLDTQFDAEILLVNGWTIRNLNENEGDMICKSCSEKEKSSKNKCLMKGCHDERYKDKLFCEYHWKERRKKNYKRNWWEK